MEILIPQRKVPILLDCDVLVCGGGPAGIAAAVSAARRGCNVALLERWPSVGGMATNALVNVWHTGDGEKVVILGLVKECIERCGRWAESPPWATGPGTYVFDPERMRVVFHDILEEAGVRTFCNITAGEPIMEGKRIKGVLAYTKRGLKGFTAKTVVDATGDGDIAAAAGVPFDLGRPEDGLVQGMTMMFRLCGFDRQKARTITQEMFDGVVRRMKELRQKGKMPPFNEGGIGCLRWAAERCIPNICPVAGDPLDEEELTRLTARARRYVFQYLEFWRRELPHMENVEIEQTGFALGIRESRRIRGLKTLDRHAVVNAVKQPDAVGHGFWSIDIHDPKGSGHTTWNDHDPNDAPPPGESYHIPLGMCLNQQVPNLAVAGRCASATHEGLASVRLQTHCMVMGEGVGTAAALALERNCAMDRLEYTALQRALKEKGVYLEEIPPAP